MILTKIFVKIGEFSYNTIINKFPSRTLRKLWLIIFGAKIKNKTVIYRNTEILKISKLNIGCRSQVGWYCLIDSRGG